MRLFVSGSFENRKKIRTWMDELEKLGHEITEDWTVHTWDGPLEQYAIDDLQGIKKADIFIMDLEGDSRGKYIELGYALAVLKPRKIMLIGGDKFANTVFKYLFNPAAFFNTFYELYYYFCNRQLFI